MPASLHYLQKIRWVAVFSAFGTAKASDGYNPPNWLFLPRGVCETRLNVQCPIEFDVVRFSSVGAAFGISRFLFGNCPNVDGNGMFVIPKDGSVDFWSSKKETSPLRVISLKIENLSEVDRGALCVMLGQAVTQ